MVYGATTKTNHDVRPRPCPGFCQHGPTSAVSRNTALLHADETSGPTTAAATITERSRLTMPKYRVTRCKRVVEDAVVEAESENAAWNKADAEDLWQVGDEEIVDCDGCEIVGADLEVPVRQEARRRQGAMPDAEWRAVPAVT
jgi:hypothetical protein